MSAVHSRMSLRNRSATFSLTCSSVTQRWKPAGYCSGFRFQPRSTSFSSSWNGSSSSEPTATTLTSGEPSSFRPGILRSLQRGDATRRRIHPLLFPQPAPRPAPEFTIQLWPFRTNVEDFGVSKETVQTWNIMVDEQCIQHKHTHRVCMRASALKMSYYNGSTSLIIINLTERITVYSCTVQFNPCNL